MNVARILIPKVNSVYLTENQTVRQGLEKLQRHHYSALPVLKESGEFFGCISEGDFLRHIMETGTANLRDHEQYRISQIMRFDFCPPLSIFTSAEEIVEQSKKQNFVPIVDDRNIFIGIVTRKDVIEFLAECAAKNE